MKIAIHDNHSVFSKGWIHYCEKNKILFSTVNAYDSDIIEKLSGVSVFLWHFQQTNYKDMLFANGLLSALEQTGTVVFPELASRWHFDDKVGQKYLLERLNIPFIPSYVFYDKKSALQWMDKTSFPKVFKLRGGSGSGNVMLVENTSKCKDLISKAFGKGFSQSNPLELLRMRYQKYKDGQKPFIFVLKGIARILFPTVYTKMAGREKGYAYFQDFIPGNKTDFRLKLVGNICWGCQRAVREGDFRASGSGNVIYDNDAIPIEMIKIAFTISKKLELISCAYDFVLLDGRPLIAEISYGFGFSDDELPNGYWTEDLIWHDKAFNPFGIMVEETLRRAQPERVNIL